MEVSGVGEVDLVYICICIISKVHHPPWIGLRVGLHVVVVVQITVVSETGIVSAVCTDLRRRLL